MNENTTYIRSFVCAVPPASAVAGLADYLEGLKRFGDFKWVGSEAIHVTLRFLGESVPEQIQKIETALSRIGGLRPFDVVFEGAEAFPGMERPRVLWLGMREGAEAMEKLAKRVEQAARNADFAPERKRFRGHLTLARAREEGPLSEVLHDALGKAPSIRWRCEEFLLMKSVLTPAGPVYTPLGRYALG